MGILDSMTGNLPGGSAGGAPIQSILADLLGGGGSAQQQTRPGLPGLVQRFEQAGHGDAARSWVGNGQNQPTDPAMLERVFGAEQINQWSQQTGMDKDGLLSALSQFLPHAVDQMTPNGEIAATHNDPAAASGGVGSAGPSDQAAMGGPERQSN